MGTARALVEQMRPNIVAEGGAESQVEVVEEIVSIISYHVSNGYNNNANLVR